MISGSRLGLVALAALPASAIAFLAPAPVFASIGCGAILGPGGTFTLDSDLGPCPDDPALTVNQATLDLGGFTLSCDRTVHPSSHVGISVLRKKAQVTNGTISDCVNGVVLAGTGQHIVEHLSLDFSNPPALTAVSVLVGSNGNKLNGNTTIGFATGFDIGSNRNTLTGNTSSALGTGVGFNVSGDHNRLTSTTTLPGNTASAFTNGFQVHGKGNTLTGNTAAHVTEIGFSVTGDLNRLTNDTVTNSDGEGFSVDGSRNRLTGNVWGDNGTAGGIGIIVNGTHNTMSYNTALGNGSNFDLWDSNPNCFTSHWSHDTFGTASQPCIH
jgi:hypothetical protein